MPVTDMLGLIRDHLDAYSTVREPDDRDSAGFMDDSLCALGIREAVGNSDMAVAFGVDAVHLTAKELAVGGSVMELIDSDVVMDHLMEDGIFDEGFGEVNAGVDTEDEVLVSETTEEALFAADESDFAEEAFGVGQFDRDRRKGSVEIADVEFVKAGLDVGNRGLHVDVRRYRCTIED